MQADFHFAQALVAEGWRQNVRMSVQDGLIATLVSDAAPEPGDECHALALPGMANVHSHAFQRGMAGLAEWGGPASDNFWSWREAMYRFALTMSPDDVEAVAAQLYVEMLEAGFTRVGEFHYQHHAPDGRPYDNLAEMAQRIAAAAADSGVNLTLLPVFYAHSNFGGMAPQARQRRFITGRDQYASLFEASRRAIAGMDGANLGIAPHSLRAATLDDIAAILPLAGDGPIHLHIAEQQKEVADCIAFSQKRSVELLFETFEVDQRWCLIHATHMSAAEIAQVAASGAVVGLCPITEANLGDGIFNGAEFLTDGGRFGVGSDSNVLIGVADELRQLEYSQRLSHRARNILTRPGQSTGRVLFETALAGGHAALGQKAWGLDTGAPADFITLDLAHPALAGRRDDSALNAWIFVAGTSAIDCVWTRGIKRVDKGRHLGRNTIAQRFGSVMERLASADISAC